MKLRAILAFALMAFSVACFAQAEDPALRKDLERFFARFDRMMAEGKNKQLFDLMAADYVNVDTQGKRMDKAQFKAAIMGMMGSVKDMHSKTLVKHVRGSGNEAVAWCEEVYTWKQKSGNGWTPMKMTSRWAESLRRTPSGGWVFFYSQELPTNEPWSFKTGGM